MSSITIKSSVVSPIAGWRRFLADSLLVGAATLVCQALGVCTSIIIRLLLDPAQMGVWQALKMALSYANYANLGVSKGAAREVAIARGRGDHAAAAASANLAFTANTVSSAVYGLALLALAAVILVQNAGPSARAWSMGLAAMSILVVLQRHVSFQVTLLRARRSFGVTSLVNLSEAALTLCAGALLVWWWGLLGLYLATALTLLASLALVEHNSPRLAWSWDRAELRRLLRIGAPMLLVGLATTLAFSMDRWVILTCSTRREFDLGCYSLALLGTAQLNGMASLFSIVAGPQYAELFGHSQDTRSVARFAARVSEVVAAAMSIVGLAAIVLAPWLLGSILPDYRAGLAPLAARVPGAVAMALAATANQHLLVVDRAWKALAALMPGMLISGLGGWWALSHGQGLIGVAWAMTASEIVYLIIASHLAFGGELRLRERARHWGIALSAVGGLAIVAMRQGADHDMAAWGGVVFVLTSSPILLCVWQGAKSRNRRCTDSN